MVAEVLNGAGVESVQGEWEEMFEVIEGEKVVKEVKKEKTSKKKARWGKRNRKNVSVQGYIWGENCFYGRKSCIHGHETSTSPSGCLRKNLSFCRN